MSFNLGNGLSLSDATQEIDAVKQKLNLPDTVQTFFSGTLQACQQSLSSEPYLILTAVLAVYIGLGILYESLVHPITILHSALGECRGDAGLRRAEVAQHVATYNADLATCRQTVLTAYQQVEDSIAASRILSQQYVQQQRAVDSAKRAVDLDTGRYETGIDPYVDVVTLQLTQLTDELNLVTVRTEQMTSSVELIQALGGGWDVAVLLTPAQVSTHLTKADRSMQH